MSPDDLSVFDSLAEEETPPPGRSGKRRKRRKRIVLWVALAVVVALVATAGVIFARLNQSTAAVEVIESAFPEESSRPAAYEGDGESSAAPINILLLGTDTREQGASLLSNLGDRADAIMVVHIPPDRKTVQVMSIMRDSWLTIPGYRTDKINAALAIGGIPMMVSTVETLISQRIDHVSIIDFAGFSGLTDALGGVTVQNQIGFSTGAYSFPAGPVEISGAEALAYVRERHAFSDSDYQRVRNQRAFLQGVISEVMTPETLVNPIRIAELLEIMSPFLASTEGLNAQYLAGLGAELAQAGGIPVIQSFTLPTAGTGTEGNQSVVYVNPDGLSIIRDAFQQESLSDFVPPPDR